MAKRQHSYPRRQFWRQALGVDYYTSGGGEAIPVIWPLGDSLARGASNPEVAGPTPTTGTVYEWDGDELVEITDSDLSNAVGGSIYPQFGIKFNERTGSKVYIVNSAFGGSTITDVDSLGRIWDDDSPDSLWDNAKTKLNGALSLPNTYLAAVVISGGVNDFREPVKPTAAEFKTAYGGLIDRINEAYQSPPIYLFQVVTSSSDNQLSSNLRNTVCELSEERENVHLALSTLGYAAQGYVSADTVHFIQDGNNKAGEQLDIYIANSSYGKKIRGMLSKFDVLPSTTHRNGWIAFFESCLANGNLDALDALQVYIASTENNQRIDFMDIAIRGVDTPTFTENSHVATNGSDNYVLTGFKSAWARRSAQDDIIVGAKIAANSTTAGTTAALFGPQATIGLYTNQGAAGIAYRSHDATTTTWNGETKYADNTLYAIGRSGGTKFLMKNKTQVHSASVASTGRPAREVTLGCRGNGSSTFDLFIAAQYEYMFAGSWANLDYEALVDDLEALAAILKS